MTDRSPVALAELADALRLPARPLFLGRKGSSPASPILIGEKDAASALEAAASWPAVDNGKHSCSEPTTRVFWSDDGAGPADGEPQRVWDRRDFATDRFGGERSVRRIRMATPGPGGLARALMKTEFFFSRATLVFTKEASTAARGATRSYLAHQAVCGLFGDFHERPYLYRSDAKGHATETVLVLSTAAPRLRSTHSVPSLSSWRRWKRSGTPTPYPKTPVSTSNFGQMPPRMYRARKALTRSGSTSWDATWRDDPQTADDPHGVYRSYLQRRLEGVAHIDRVRVTKRGQVKVRRTLQHGAPIVFVTTDLIGTLTIQDPERLRERIARGIGRSRSLGCGLLCLSRPGTVLARRHATSLDALHI